MGNMKTISPILGELLEKIYHNKKITTREMDFSSRNIWIKVARDYGFVLIDGLGDRNEHIYALTSTGVKMAELWIQIKELLNNGKNIREQGQKIKNVHIALKGNNLHKKPHDKLTEFDLLDEDGYG
jgi:hypothetical protein